MEGSPDPAGSRAGTTRAQLALLAAAQVLRPLVGLLLASGVKHAAIDEALRELLVEQARTKVPGAAQARAVSRISVATGLHRKDVKRLLTSPSRTGDLEQRAAGSEVFTRWMTDKRYLDSAGRPRLLPRQEVGRGLPSFEELAREVSRDVHPRAILEELLRLGIARLDERDRVCLLTDAFVPAAGDREMFRFLAGNVSDHLSAAIANVDGPNDRFLEQAVFADELSPESVARIEQLARSHWRRLLRALAPRMQALVDRDRTQGRTADRRARIGMYSYATEMDGAAAAAPERDNVRGPAKPARVSPAVAGKNKGNKPARVRAPAAPRRKKESSR